MRRARWSRWPAVVGVAVLVAALLAAAVTDVQAHARVRAEHRDVTRAEATLADARAVLATTTLVRGLTAAHQKALRADVAFTLAIMANSEQTFTGTTQAEFLQGLDIGALQTCLDGVKSALGQIAAHDTNGAAVALTAVATSCLELEGGSASGLVYPFDFPDPFVLTVGDTYFAYATNSVGGNIQVLESTDHTNWHALADALPTLPSWAAPDRTWAPAVLSIGGQYVLYYAAVYTLTGQQCLSEAVAPQPQGPFVDTSTAPLVCQVPDGGDIDPDPFVDANGTPYLLWKSIGQPELIWSQQLDPAGTATTGTGPTAILAATQHWEDGIVEAPDLVLDAGRYILFYSGNSWQSANYAVGVAFCSGPLGPCNKPSTQPILVSGPGDAGPGGESVFTDPTGAWWIAFHAWTPGAVGYPNNRPLFVRPLDLAGALPAVGPAG